MWNKERLWGLADSEISLPLSKPKLTSRMAKRYEELEKLVSEILVDLRKFYDDGNKAAGTRARKGLLALKNWAHEVRKEISAERAKAEASGSSKGAAKSKSAPAKKAPPKPKKK
jgi:hypothetical protein